MSECLWLCMRVTQVTSCLGSKDELTVHRPEVLKGLEGSERAIAQLVWAPSMNTSPCPLCVHCNMFGRGVCVHAVCVCVHACVCVRICAHVQVLLLRAYSGACSTYLGACFAEVCAYASSVLAYMLCLLCAAYGCACLLMYASHSHA
jgi:hypothetical protein